MDIPKFLTKRSKMTDSKHKDNFKIIPLSNLFASKTNPRVEFNQKELSELADSIKSHGVIQPIIVRPNGKKEKFEIVSGERRYRASELAGNESIPAIIRQLDDEAVLEIQIIENLQRVDIHPLHEAEGFQKIIDTGRYTKELLASKIGKSKKYVAQRIKLNDLVIDGKTRFYKGDLLLGHALLIAKLQEKDQVSVLKWHLQQMSVVQLASGILSNYLIKLSNAPFNTKDTQLVPEIGSCQDCKMRSGYEQSLFPELKEDDHCTYVKCWNEKISAHIDGEMTAAVANQKELIKASENFTQEEGVLPYYKYSCDKEAPREDFHQKDIILVDGPEAGFIKKVWVEEEEEEVELTEEEQKVEEELEELDRKNSSIRIKRQNKIAFRTAEDVFKKFNEIREFTPLTLKQLAKSHIESNWLDDDLFKLLELVKVESNEEENEFNVGLYIEECDDPAKLKDFILCAVLVEMLNDDLKEMAVSEYDIDVKKITKEVNKEFPLEK